MPNKPDLQNDFPQIKKSQELYKRALESIPCVTQTLAKGPGQHTKGVAPIYATKGKGAHVWDADGNEYIDYTMAVGPLSLGYCYEAVDAAIREQLADGITFSLMHPLEVEVAELVKEIIPNAESVRFSKTGCDVTTAAVRLARAFTGKNTVLCCGYHGWHDWYIGVTDRSAGIPQETKDLTYTFSYNDFDSVLAAVDDDTAAIILEPIVFEAPKDNFLHKLRELCDERGIVLIFDEMWTGFRLALGGAQEYFGVKADLACYSKAVANGMPISILAGRRDIMQLLEKDVFFFTTFGGEALSLAAAKATMEELRDKNVPQYLDKQGEKLKNGYNEIATELGINHYTKCAGFNCRTIMSFDASAGNPLELKTLVQQEMIKRGVLWGGFHNMSFSHTDADIEFTLSAYREVLPILKEAVKSGDVKSFLKGEAVEAVFRKTGNFNMKPKRAAEVNQA
ncbi:MAG: aminotransferase class III-fold pyridoxal phosphate-dependent enzyme [Bacteroidota bacterium]